MDSDQVVNARKKLLDAIYAIADVTGIKADWYLAMELNQAWDAYDQAVIRQHVTSTQGPG